MIDNKILSMTKITIPALAIGGGGHGGMGQYQIDMMNRFAIDVTGMVLPDCGHWLPEECPAALNQAVTQFLDQS